MLTLQDLYGKSPYGYLQSFVTFQNNAVVLDANGKVASRRQFIQTPLATAQFNAHKQGVYCISASPFVDDSHVNFGVIDIDIYARGIAELVAPLFEGMPVHLFRSLSGGVHLTYFFQKEIPAATAQALLEHSMQSTGLLEVLRTMYPGAREKVEVFPKQSRIPAGGHSSTIRLPFFNGTATCLVNGDWADETAFFSRWGDHSWFDPSKVSLIPVSSQGNSPQNPSNAALAQMKMPPCVHTAFSHPFDQHRNDILFNAGVFLRREMAAVWEDQIRHLNERNASPPLAGKELDTLIKSLNTKNFRFKCKNNPLCQRKECMQVLSGIPSVDSVTQILTDPPVYVIRTPTFTMKVGSRALHDQQIFRQAVLDQGSKGIRSVDKTVWEEFVTAITSDMIVEEPPTSITVAGRIRMLLAEYFDRASRSENYVMSEEEWERALGLSIPVERDGFWFFTGEAVQTYLMIRLRKDAPKPVDLWVLLSDMGAVEARVSVKGKRRNVIKLPSEALETEIEATRMTYQHFRELPKE